MKEDSPNVKTGSRNLCIFHLGNIAHRKLYLFILSLNKTNYIIEVMELYYYFVHKCMYKERHFSTTRYCETHAPLPFRRLLIADCRLCIRYTMVRGHICMLQRNRDIYYYYYYQYNTIQLN